MQPKDFALNRACLASTSRRRGFTLTELLVVIAIIAMLAALVSVAVVRALDTAKQTAMKTELDQIDTSLKAYKEKYGAFPPCDLGFQRYPTPQKKVAFARIRQHVAMAFPRYDVNQLIPDLTAAGVDVNNFRPDQALVFWLRGFSSDPLHPFVTIDNRLINYGTPGTTVTRTSFLDFDTARLAQVASPTNPNPIVMPSYFPKGGTPGATSAPYLYLDAGCYSANGPVQQDPTVAPSANSRIVFNDNSNRIFTNAGTAIQYIFDANKNNVFDVGENWANPDSFQLICAGGDGKYGDSNATASSIDRLFPTGLGYDTSTSLADEDNVTNFAAGARLGDAKP